MYPFDKNNLFRKISIKIFFPIFWKLGWSAPFITTFNFIVFGISSLICFLKGYELQGLFLAGIMAMIDYVDGTIGRAGRGSPLGAYLDISLDWLYLMLLIGAISYQHDIMLFGYITLIAITFSNWVEYNGLVNYELPKCLGIIPLLLIFIFTNHLKYGILCIMITQSYRAGRLYLCSISKISQ